MCQMDTVMALPLPIQNVPTPPTLPRISGTPRRNTPILPNRKGSPCLAELMNEGLRYLIPDRLAFISGTLERLQSIRQAHEGTKMRFFSSDLHQQYDPFGNDFGPVNLGIVTRFCASLQKLLDKEQHDTLVYCIDTTFETQANASFLLSAYLMLKCGRTPQEAADPFTCTTAPFTLRPFRDCTNAPQSYEITILDCLHGLSKAVGLGWYDADNFDLDLYDELDDPVNGDIHRVCPRFVAFKGPLKDGSAHRVRDEIALAPAAYAPTLRRIGVSLVIRLNDSDTYDPAEFESRGLRHRDLYFHDCTAPPDHIVETFLDLCDSEQLEEEGKRITGSHGAGSTNLIAVHCRGGLGRTGTLIALWMMKHCKFTANEAIGWLRIVRPGSVIGPQQQYLKDCESRPWHGNRLGRTFSPGSPVQVDYSQAAAFRRLPPSSDCIQVANLKISGPGEPSHCPPPGPPALTKRLTPPARPPGGGGVGGLPVSAARGAAPGPSAAELSQQVTAGMSRRGVVKALHALLPSIVSRFSPFAAAPLPPGQPAVRAPAAAGGGGGAGGSFLSPRPPAGPAASARLSRGGGGRLSLSGLTVPSRVGSSESGTLSRRAERSLSDV